MSFRDGAAPAGPHSRISTRLLIERLVWGAGLVCLGAWALAGLLSVVGRYAAMQRFRQPDQSLWAEQRIAFVGPAPQRYIVRAVLPPVGPRSN